MGERHNRAFTHIHLKTRDWVAYRRSFGADKVQQHLVLFYGRDSWQTPSTDTVRVIHPLMAGVIPRDAAFGESKYGERKDDA